MAQAKGQVKTVSPRRLWLYLCGPLRLKSYLQAPGDRRPRPQIPATTLLWSLLMGRWLRQGSYHAVEFLVRSQARLALGIARRFGDDALAYFTERVDPGAMRSALAGVVRRAKRNKAFDPRRWIGLALDGTGAGRSRQRRCRLCRPRRDQRGQRRGYGHNLCLLSVVGAGLTLPVDVEPYRRGEGELTAGLRLVQRAVAQLGRRFAQYLVVDAEYAGARFLHAVGALGLRVVVRLKGNLPELQQAAQARFQNQPPRLVFHEGPDRVEVWDADDFDPWEGLAWSTVRVLRYRQHKPDGTVVEAYWLTDLSPNWVGGRTLYRLAKSRWEIENQGFNDGKNRYGLEHIGHHHANSLVIEWLLILLALTVERLYRLRYLHRGTHPAPTSVQLMRRLWLSLSAAAILDTS